MMVQRYGLDGIDDEMKPFHDGYWAKYEDAAALEQKNAELVEDAKELEIKNTIAWKKADELEAENALLRKRLTSLINFVPDGWPMPLGYSNFVMEMKEGE